MYFYGKKRSLALMNRYLLMRLKNEKKLWPVFIMPAVALVGIGIAVWQINLLGEQISTLYEPGVTVIARTQLQYDWEGPMNELFIANFGNEPIENADIKLKLFLVTDDLIYTYGQLGGRFRSEIYDTALSARDREWQGLSLPANSREMSIQKYLLLELGLGYWKINPCHDELIKELEALREAFNGEFILYVETNYRRKRDYLLMADTSYWYYSPRGGPIDNMRNYIGGPAVITRLKEHLQDGEMMKVGIRETGYDIYKFNKFGHVVDVKSIFINVMPHQRTCWYSCHPDNCP